MSTKNRLVHEGIKLPSKAPITQNERDRIDMLRCIVGHADPNVQAVQALRRALVEGQRELAPLSIV